ncbi:hypothetical protein BD310DRAFT_530329 [Dichomitus squalens]|uniref:Uncharacterized protein n=1 Tax=Dichomitus squalens TaxID=114155 RepID=A0A4Q9Q8I8_9APHY|nr:hypothetical protein BD310DRAFT_530329 [Dichomitus squalens]
MFRPLDSSGLLSGADRVTRSGAYSLHPRVSSPHMLQTSFYRSSRGASPPDTPRSSYVAAHHRKQASFRVELRGHYHHQTCLRPFWAVLRVIRTGLLGILLALLGRVPWQSTACNRDRALSVACAHRGNESADGRGIGEKPTEGRLGLRLPHYSRDFPDPTIWHAKP